MTLTKIQMTLTQGNTNELSGEKTYDETNRIIYRDDLILSPE